MGAIKARRGNKKKGCTMQHKVHAAQVCSSGDAGGWIIFFCKTIIFAKGMQQQHGAENCPVFSRDLTF